MFRSLFGGSRTVRVPINTANVDVQTVKVTRPSKSMLKSFLITCALTTCAIQAVKYFDPQDSDQIRRTVHKDLERLQREGMLSDKRRQHGQPSNRDKPQSVSLAAKDVSGRDDAPTVVNLPLPIWLARGEQRGYMNTDVEWKEYAKLQGDQKRQEHLKRTITETCLEQVKRTKKHESHLRLIAYNGKVISQLEIIPSLFTPPLYFIPCLFFSTSSIEFGWRQLPPDTGARMERVFRPFVLLDAATVAARVFIHTTYAITKAKVNESLGRGQANASGFKPEISIPHVPPATASDAKTSDPISKSTKPIFPFFPDMSNSQTTRKMHQDLVSAMPYHSAIKQAAAAFNHVKNQRQKTAVAANVPGVCQIKGSLSFMGDRGKYRMHIVAYYLPSENVFVGAIQLKDSYTVLNFHTLEQQFHEHQRQAEQNIKRRRLERDAPSAVQADEAGKSPTSASTDDKETKN